MLYEILDLPLLILSFILSILLVTGFFSPEKSLFWYKKERTKKWSFIIYFSSIMVIGLIHEGIKPRKLVDEELRLEKIEKEQRLLKEKKQKEEEELNSVYRIENCNEFKDNPKQFKGLKIQDVFYFHPDNKYTLRDIIEKTRKYTNNKTVKLVFFHLDKHGNDCKVEVEVPITMDVPNITSSDEKVLLNFTCSEGELNKGNTLVSITRVN